MLQAARWKYRRQNYAKIAICAPSHNFVGLYLRSEGMYRQMEKDLLNSNISSTCRQNMVNVGLLTNEITLRVLGTPTNFNGFRGQPHFARCLAVSWPGTLYIHFWGICTPKGILSGAKFTLRRKVNFAPARSPGAKFTLRPSLALSYTGSVTARHSSSGRQPNFEAWYLHATGRPSRPALGGLTV